MHPTGMHSCFEESFSFQNQQECIPVGCVPSAAVAVRGVSAWVGVCQVHAGILTPGQTPAVNRMTDRQV